jgi:hypothetical protein
MRRQTCNLLQSSSHRCRRSPRRLARLETRLAQSLCRPKDGRGGRPATRARVFRPGATPGARAAPARLARGPTRCGWLRLALAARGCARAAGRPARCPGASTVHASLHWAGRRSCALAAGEPPGRRPRCPLRPPARVLAGLRHGGSLHRGGWASRGEPLFLWPKFQVLPRAPQPRVARPRRPPPEPPKTGLVPGQGRGAACRPPRPRALPQAPLRQPRSRAIRRLAVVHLWHRQQAQLPRLSPAPAPTRARALPGPGSAPTPPIQPAHAVAPRSAPIGRREGS